MEVKSRLCIFTHARGKLLIFRDHFAAAFACLRREHFFHFLSRLLVWKLIMVNQVFHITHSTNVFRFAAAASVLLIQQQTLSDIQHSSFGVQEVIDFQSRIDGSFYNSKTRVLGSQACATSEKTLIFLSTFNQMERRDSR